MSDEFQHEFQLFDTPEVVFGEDVRLERVERSIRRRMRQRGWRKRFSMQLVNELAERFGVTGGDVLRIIRRIGRRRRKRGQAARAVA